MKAGHYRHQTENHIVEHRRHSCLLERNSIGKWIDVKLYHSEVLVLSRVSVMVLVVIDLLKRLRKTSLRQDLPVRNPGME